MKSNKLIWLILFFTFLSGNAFSFTLTITADSVTCNGANDGKIIVNVNGGGVAPFIYSWSTGQKDTSNFPVDSLVNLAPGFYWIVVTDAALESHFESVFVYEPSLLSIDSETKTDVTCNGNNDGTITITSSGGTTPYMYSIDGGVTFFNNGGTFTGLSPGSYDVAVTDYHGCTTLGNTLTINNPSIISIDSETKTDVSCNGGSDGTITITASGGTLPYQYSNDGGTTFVSNNGNFSGLTAGNYDVAVRDTNGCIQNGSTLTINQPTPISIDSETKTDVSCNGGSDGTITITASGGTPLYQYSIDGGTTFVSNGGNFSGLTAGNYDVAVRDNNGCIQNGSTLTINQPTAISIDSETKTDVSCNGGSDGTISITASGGTLPYQYSIDGGTTFVSNGGNFSGLTPGNYDVAVRDNNGCVQNGSTLTISQPTAISIDSETKTDVSCNGGSNGTITITASGGTPPYQYSIDGGTTFVSNGGNFSGLTAGNYDVAIRDTNGCTQNGSTLTISQPTAISIDSETKTDVSCNGGNDGTITITASGGTPPYQYSIDGGTSFVSNGGNFSGLTAGNYDVAVRDNNGCVQNGSTLTINQPASISIDSETKTDITCNGLTDGTISISASGGTLPYQYSIDGGTTFVSNGGNFSGLTAGNYDVAVRDNNGCIQNGSTLTISQPTAISIDSETKTDVSCNGGSDGTISITASGGTPTYQYSIDGGTTFVSNGGNFSGLTAGNYDVAVRDNNGCIQNGSTLSISQPTAISIDSETKTDVSCNGGSDGTITITASGGTPTYQYSIDGGTTFSSNGGNFSGLTAGNYDVAVRDNNGCIQNGSTLTINQPTAISIDAQTKTDITCNGLTDGTISISASGGTPPYQYSIDGGISFLSNSGNFSGLGAGNYDIAVRDTAGCTQNGATLTISEPSALTINSETSTDISCNGLTDGSVTVTATGGTGTLQYTLTPGAITNTTGTFTALAANNYTVSVDDANNCGPVNSSNLTVSEPSAISIDSETKTDVSCNGGSDGTITISASGGTPPYQYSIDGGTAFVSNGGNFSGLIAGNYDVAVRDNNGCIQNGSTLTISQPTAISIDAQTKTDVTCFGGSDGTLTISVSGGTPPYEFSVDSGTTFFSNGGVFTGLTSGNYDVVVRDSKNCSQAGVPVTIGEPLQISIDSEMKSDVTCAGLSDGTITVTASGGTPPYDFSIDGGVTFVNGGSFTGLPPGNYDIAVRDAAGCIKNGSTLTVIDPPALVIDSIDYSDLSCYQDNSGTITIFATGGTGPVSYSVDGGMTYLQNGGSFTGLSANSYTLIIKDSNNCITGGPVISLSEPAPISVLADTVKASCSKNTFDGEILLTGSGGTLPYRFSVDSGMSFSDSGHFTGLEGGLYDLVVLDSNQCEWNGNILLEGKTIVIADAGQDTSVCPGESIQLSGNGGTSFSWSPATFLDDPNTSSPLATPESTTRYYLTANTGSCFDTDSVLVTVHPLYGITAGPDTTVFRGDPVTLNAAGTGFVAYTWTPATWLSSTSGSTVDASPEQDIVYYVIGETPEGCFETDSLTITIIQEILVPSGFTPNGDGTNDTWHIGSAANYPGIIVEVFDRWGQRIFYSKGYGVSQEWDGTYNGKPVASGTYYYIIRLNDPAGTAPLTGPVTIIR